MEAQALLIERLHKACGSVELARDLLGRSGSLYLQAETMPDSHVAGCFDDAARALATVVEALKSKLGETSLGPAA